MTTDDVPVEKVAKLVDIFHGLAHSGKVPVPTRSFPFPFPVLMFGPGLPMRSVYLSLPKGAFTQSVLRAVIRHRLGYLINKKCCFH